MISRKIRSFSSTLMSSLTLLGHFTCFQTSEAICRLDLHTARIRHCLAAMNYQAYRASLPYHIKITIFYALFFCSCSRDFFRFLKYLPKFVCRLSEVWLCMAFAIAPLLPTNKTFLAPLVTAV